MALSGCPCRLMYVAAVRSECKGDVLRYFTNAGRNREVDVVYGVVVADRRAVAVAEEVPHHRTGSRT